MLSSLVDNSTLTSVQRLIGDVPVALSFTIEGDITAYDQYLQSRLIYDEVVAVDDYKEEYRIERKGRFNEVHFLSPGDVEYAAATSSSLQAMEGIGYQIERGCLIAGPIPDYLQALGLQVLPAWYMQSSEWFLHLRILAEEADVHAPKYGILMNSIQAQLSQSKRSLSDKLDNLVIQTTDGHNVNNEAKGDWSIAQDVKLFSLGLSWIAQRSAFYIDLANRLQTAFTLHPIRHAFAGQYILGHLMPQVSKDIREGAISFFTQNARRIRQESDQIIASSGLGMSLPFFAAWAVGYAGNPKSGYDHVLQIRGSKAATTLRRRFREIEGLDRGTNGLAMRREAAKLRSAINADLDKLRSEFTGKGKHEPVDVSVDMLTLSPSVSITGLARKIGVTLPDHNWRATTLLRDLFRDLMQIPTLGDVSDKFSLSRKIRKGTEFVPDRTRVEALKWKNASPYWKKPL